jgi:SulP family sulfate permease
MAFAMSSGLPPQTGLYCAIVAGFIISRSEDRARRLADRQAPFVVVVAGIAQTYGFEGLLLCTMLAGVFLVVLGVTGLGTAVKYIPRAVVIGFTNGIAILIASTQLKTSSGFRSRTFPGDFLGRIGAIVEHWNTLSLRRRFWQVPP